MLLTNDHYPQPALRGPHPRQNQAIPDGGASFQPNSVCVGNSLQGCDGAQGRGLRRAGRAVSQRLQYFSSSCSAGDKGLPSPFPGAWERRASTLQSGIGVPEVSSFRKMNKNDPFWDTQRNLLRGLSRPGVMRRPHPTC